MDTTKLPDLFIENVKPLLKEYMVFDVDWEMQLEETSFFVLINKQLPSKIEFSLDKDSVTQIITEMYSRYKIPRGNITSYLNIDHSDQRELIMMVNRNLFIHFKDEYFASISIFYPYGLYSEFINGIKDLAIKLEKKNQKAKDNFHMILFHKSHGKLELKVKQFQLKPFKINIEENYNDDFLPVHKRITERLNTPDDKGIVLLHGDPGTGKTTYIRYLARTLNKKIIYIPPQFSADLTSTTFMELMLQHTNSVLIIEDAENIIEDRNLGRNLSVSGLLNIADGLLSFCLKLQIICTFNTNLSRIDPALLRKGRLIALYEFKELEIEKAQQLVENLDLKFSVTKPMTLAQIYGQKDHDFEYVPKTVSGFKKV